MSSELVRFNQEVAAAWPAAAQLHDHVLAGGLPTSMPPTIALLPPEQQFGHITLDFAMYSGADVEYMQSWTWGGGLIFGAASMAASAAANSARRRKAERMAAAQWRPYGRVPVVLTDNRLITCVQNQWSTFYLRSLIQVHPLPREYAVVLSFDSCDPVRLTGPWAPWATVVICAILFGRPWPPGFDGTGVFTAAP